MRECSYMAYNNLIIMTTETRLTRKELEKLTITQIVDDDRVKGRFVELYNARTRTADGMAQYAQATESFIRAIQEDPNLQQCTALSLYNAFMDMAFYGINVAKQSKPLAYLLWNNVNVGTKDEKRYEKRANLEISPYGEMSIRQMMGQIKYADDPVIVYEEDEYSGIIYENGQKTVRYKKNLRSKSRKIIAAFMKIVRNDGSTDFVEMDIHQVNRLKGYSERKNRGVANALYSSNSGQIDEGFLKAKLIKHAFSAYPRINTSNSKAVFSTDKVDEPEMPSDVYGLDDEPEVISPDVEDADDAQIINANESF